MTDGGETKKKKPSELRHWFRITCRTLHLISTSVLVGGHFFAAPADSLRPWLYGVIASGGTPQDVLNITQMLVKTCRIAAGTVAGGGPRFLSDQNVERIDRRPDELARRQRLASPEK